MIKSSIASILAIACLPIFAADLPDFTLDNSPVKRQHPAERFGYSHVVKRVRPAVVSVFPTKILNESDTSKEDLMKRYFGGGGDSDKEKEGERKEEQGAGSGVLISADGLILTNNHVIAGPDGGPADELSVELADRRRFTAKLIGTDPLTDIAVLQIPAKDLPYLKLADSRAIEIGDVVFAAGNPFKVGLTVTMGIVSAVDRADLDVLRKKAYELFIQTDAPINPGNSGGALVDVRGRLVGINTAIIGNGGNVGIGFAVPTRVAHRVLDSFLTHGELRRAFLGAAVEDVTPEIAESANLPAIAGVIIREVGADLPAATAGLKPNDVITAIKDDPVTTRGAFRTLAAYSRIGEAIPFTVYRDGKKQMISVILANRDNPEQAATSLVEPVTLAKNLSALPLTESLKASLKLPEDLDGLVVQAPENGQLPGDLKANEVIVSINDKPANSLEGRQALRSGINKLRIYTGKRFRHAALRLPPNQ